MSETTFRRSLPKRILLILAGLVMFTLLFVMACRIAVQQVFRGVESSKATGLSAIAWDMNSMWSQGGLSVDSARIAESNTGKISRRADLRTCSSSFDRSVAQLHTVVIARRGYFEDLRTASRSKQGRMMAADLSVPSSEFDNALSDLKRIGRVEAISESGEDSTVRRARAARHVEAMQINLARLQKLQQDRKGELRDATALEKEIAPARQAVAEAELQHEDLLSRIAQARIRFTLVEEYRAPWESNLTGVSLRMRNSLVEGVTATFSSAAIFVGVLLEYGLPLLFWIALLGWPSRLLWQRFHPRVSNAAAVE